LDDERVAATRGFCLDLRFGPAQKNQSGRISDKLRKRKALTILGYGLGALSKPLFAVAPTSSLVLAARFSDGVGKGIRGAPRDAMVGDMVPVGLRGAAYGLRQSLDTVGAFAGPLIAITLMAALHDDFRLVFWLALIPGLLSVLVLSSVCASLRTPTPRSQYR
jgi:predicted MFS family arabinose efflux permease